MKSKSTSLSIIPWTALALLTLCFIKLPVRANPITINPGAAQSSHVDLYQNIWVYGLTRGQTLRYTWANLNDPDPQEREFETLRIQVKLLAADGSVIEQAAAATVGVGQFQSFEFNRDQINLPGEPTTGRLQVRLEATVIGSLRHPDRPLKRGILETFDAAGEIIATATGETTASSKPKEIVVVGSKCCQ